MAKKSFESALSRLEQITAEMEAGNLSLEKSLARFGEGIELAAYCNQVLTAARGRVELLTADDGALQAAPWPEDGGEPEEPSDEARDEAPDDDELPF